MTACQIIFDRGTSFGKKKPLRSKHPFYQDDFALWHRQHSWLVITFVRTLPPPPKPLSYLYKTAEDTHPRSISGTHLMWKVGRTAATCDRAPSDHDGRVTSTTGGALRKGFLRRSVSRAATWLSARLSMCDRSTSYPRPKLRNLLDSAVTNLEFVPDNLNGLKGKFRD